MTQPPMNGPSYGQPYAPQPQPGYSPQAYPPPGQGAFVPPQPAPKKRRKWPWVLLAIVVLLVIAGIAGGNKKAASTSSPNATSSLASVPPTISDASPSAVETTSAPAPAPKPAAPVKVLDMPGSGIKKSANFIVAADQWTIAYTFDCANFGGTGNFQIMVYNADGSLSDLAANALKASGKDSTVEHGAGKYYLEMNSECDWHVTVTG